MTHPVNRTTFSKVLNSEFNFRLDSSYVLNYTLYIRLLDALKKAGVVVEKASGLIKIRRERVGEAVTTATILIKSLWKASIHPLKLELRTQEGRYQCEELDIIGVATGLGSIGKFSVVPKYLKEIVEKPLATTGDLVVLELKPDRPSEDSYYMVTLLNTKFGKLVADTLTYGSTGQLHLDVKHLERVYIPVIDSYKSVADNMKIAVEEYESRAWRAYFNAMKIVEEYLGKPEELVFSVVRARDIEKTIRFRIDPSRLLILGVVSKLISKYGGRVHKASDLLEVHTTGVPREKRYKVKEGQHPLITIDSIDESGIIDDEKIYYITGKKRPYPKGSILLVKDGASIGKTGILPYDAYVMQGIATLICRPNVDESLKYYVFATLKSSLYKRVIEALGYGATVQYSITKDEIESLEIPVIEEIAKDVSRYMKEFVENMYQANVLKKQAVMELENYILRLIS